MIIEVQCPGCTTTMLFLSMMVSDVGVWVCGGAWCGWWLRLRDGDKTIHWLRSVSLPTGTAWLPRCPLVAVGTPPEGTQCQLLHYYTNVPLVFPISDLQPYEDPGPVGCSKYFSQSIYKYCTVLAGGIYLNFIPQSSSLVKKNNKNYISQLFTYRLKCWEVCCNGQ